jgi:hypothetical protein
VWISSARIENRGCGGWTSAGGVPPEQCYLVVFTPSCGLACGGGIVGVEARSNSIGTILPQRYVCVGREKYGQTGVRTRDRPISRRER